MTQWINSWFRQLTTVLALSRYEQINADSKWCGEASQNYFFFVVFFCYFCLAGDTLTQCTTFHGSFPCIIVMIKINPRASPKQLVHGLQIQSSYNIIYILKYIC